MAECGSEKTRVLAYFTQCNSVKILAIVSQKNLPSKSKSSLISRFYRDRDVLKTLPNITDGAF